MLGSEILEIAIGVVFTFLLLSLTASTIREAFEGLLKTRAIQLERGLREMLDDPEGCGITKELFDHPLLYGLFAGNYDPKKQLTNFFVPRKSLVVANDGTQSTIRPKRIEFRSNLPAYVPSRNFAMALLDLASKQAGGGVLSLEAARQTAVTLQNQRLRQALLVAIGEAEGDIDRARTSLEAWFDGTMDRVSGWYKRETQWILLGLGLLLAVGLNVDCLHVARSLALNNTVRQTIIQTVEADQKTWQAQGGSVTGGADTAAPAGTSTGPAPTAAAIPQEQVEAQLSGLSDIIGWPQFDAAVERQIDPNAGTSDGKPRIVAPGLPGSRWRIWAWELLLSIPGWLISAFAVSLGAPFWFDVLNKLMVVRSTVKPYEKSPSEGSGDRKADVAAASLLAPKPVTVVGDDQKPSEPESHPDAPPATVAVRLAFDLAPDSVTDLSLAVDTDAPKPVVSPYMVEIAVAANMPHRLAATATLDGMVVSWADDITPHLDDDGWPILATLA